MSVPYYGDFAEDDTVNLPWNSFDSNDPSNSVTVTDLIASDIFVHKDGSATAITTDGASIDIDAPGVGAHMITIDTSVDADYATGSEYAVRINGVTVDGGTVNAWIGAFSIERAGAALALLKGTNSLANIEDKIDIIDTNVDQIETAVITNAAGVDISADIAVIEGQTDDIGVAGAGLSAIPIVPANMTQLGGSAQSATDLKDFADAGYDPGTNKVQGVVLVDTTTANTDMRGTDSAALASVVGALADAAAAGDPTSVDTLMQYIKQLINTLEGTVGIPVFPGEAAPANNVSLAEVIRRTSDDVLGLAGSVMRGTDGVDTATMRGTDSAALASVCTEGRLAELDAANIPADIDAIPTTAMRGTDSAALASEVTSERMATLTDWIDGGRLDLLLDAIKTATDKLTFTVANQLDANIQSVNDGPVDGTGFEGNEWGPV